MSEDDPGLVEHMLRWMYKPGRVEIPDDLHSDVSPLGYCAAIARIADQYDVPKLAKAAVAAFRMWLFERPYNYITAVLLDQVAPIYDLLPENDRRLRDPLVMAIAREYVLIRDKKESLPYRDAAFKFLNEAVKTHSDFASDLVDILNRKTVENMQLRPHSNAYGYSKITCSCCDQGFEFPSEHDDSLEGLGTKCFWNACPGGTQDPVRGRVWFTFDACLIYTAIGMEWDRHLSGVFRRMPADEGRPFYAQLYVEH